MKRPTSPSFNLDSKTIECVTRFELIPPNLVSKDNPIFSAFSRPKLRRFHILDHHDPKSQRPQTNQRLKTKPNQENTYNSLLLHKSKDPNNMFQGLLKTRKSHMKKIKLKEFYIEDYEEHKLLMDHSILLNQGKVYAVPSKNSTEFNTIESRHSEAPSKNFFLPSRKKLLPAKLRAKSYSNIPKNYKDRSVEPQDQNSLYVKAKKSHNAICTQKFGNLTLDHEVSATRQSSVKTNARRNLRTGKVRKISHFEEKPFKGLEDITLQMNEQEHVELHSEKDLKKGFQRHQSIRHRRNLKSQNVAQIESIIDINPWGHGQNEDDKENEFFIYS